jgi:hypothetical protein
MLITFKLFPLLWKWLINLAPSGMNLSMIIWGVGSFWTLYDWLDEVLADDIVVVSDRYDLYELLFFNGLCECEIWEIYGRPRRSTINEDLIWCYWWLICEIELRSSILTFGWKSYLEDLKLITDVEANLECWLSIWNSLRGGFEG